MSAVTSSLRTNSWRRRRFGRIAQFATLNVLGGTAVLASYVWGVGAPGVGTALWGGVPESLRPLYTINMFLAAGGYFFFTMVALRRLARGGSTPDRDRFARRMLRGYALVLVPSALWLPLTAWMLHAPSQIAWLAVRLDLALVALGALALYELVLRPGEGPRAERWLALVGLLPFSLQTVVLDALVWPWFFETAAISGASS